MRHIIFDSQNNCVFCRHCGRHQDIQSPIPITKMVEVMGQFEAEHERCPATDALHIPGQPDRPLPVNAGYLTPWPGLEDWMRHGQHGVSSLTLAAALTNLPLLDGPPAAPCDASDFGRCVGLLRAVPSLRLSMGAASGQLGPAWAGLIANWAQLEDLLKVDGEAGWRQLTDRINALTKQPDSSVD